MELFEGSQQDCCDQGRLIENLAVICKVWYELLHQALMVHVGLRGKRWISAADDLRSFHEYCVEQHRVRQGQLWNLRRKYIM